MNPFREQRAKALAAGVAPVRADGRFRAEADTDGNHIYIYDVIDPWGGYWGISAAEMVRALAGITGTVTVHLNSPGGDVWEAAAMHSVLREHKGQIHIHVDGVAASAASFLMTTGNRVEVAPHAQVMIHDAWSMSVGNEAELTADAILLGRMSQDMAKAYAKHAGGEPDEWRERMSTQDTWYIGADEIIAAGLADAVIPEGGVGEQVGQDADAFAAAARTVFAPAAAARARNAPGGATVLPGPAPASLSPPPAVGVAAPQGAGAGASDDLTIPDFASFRAALGRMITG